MKIYRAVSIVMLLLVMLVAGSHAAPVMSDDDRVALTQSATLKDDVVIIIKAPVMFISGNLSPDIPHDLWKLRRADSIIYDSDKNGSQATSCLVVMIVPKENAAELIARVSEYPRLTLVTQDKEADEAIAFHDLSALKSRTELSISSEGK